MFTKKYLFGLNKLRFERKLLASSVESSKFALKTQSNKKSKIH